jgi:hypothetical protein
MHPSMVNRTKKLLTLHDNISALLSAGLHFVFSSKNNIESEEIVKQKPS